MVNAASVGRVLQLVATPKAGRRGLRKRTAEEPQGDGVLWPLLMVLLVRHLLKPKGQKVAERAQAKAKHAETLRRVETVIQMQLTAHGLPDTKRNRALVATAISQERSSGMGR